jgi:choline dehydrogenase-like flavoprotein
MIRDILNFEDDDEARADVAVVGSGVAGIVLARRLARCGLSVVVLESGRRDFDPAIQALNDVRFEGKPHRVYTPDAAFHGYLPEHYRGQNRLRQFGGTSNSWTGKWRPFLRDDLEGRPWIPHSDWPISLEDLAPYYETVSEELGIGYIPEGADNEFFPPGRQAELRPFDLRAAIWSWEGRTTRVPDRFGDELEASTDIDLILGATVTELRLGDEPGRVASASCRSLEGRRLTVRADRFVLASGGLEVPRLLLASNRQVETGLGNERGLVGRFYLEHPKYQDGTLIPGPRMGSLAECVQTRPRPRFCLAFSLSNEVQERLGLLRHMISLSPRYEAPRDRLLRALRRRPACRDGLSTVRRYRVKFATEQAPNPESRVRLGTRRDALGMPELVVDWRFTELDHRSIALATRELKDAFRRAGLGTMSFGREPMTVDEMMDAAHPMGTTRMADSPERGVVDPHCRVFGTRNLYVASSSVFPTGAVYSPTFTIVALARRLADHLVESSPAVRHA